MVRVCTWARTEVWWVYVPEQGLKNDECMYLSKDWKMMSACTWARTEEWWVYVPEQGLKYDECMYLSKDWRMMSVRTWARTEEWWVYVPEQGLKNGWVYVPEQGLKNDECMYLSKDWRMDECMYLSKDWRMTSACTWARMSVLYSVYLSKYSSVNQEMQTDSMRASLGLSTALPCKSCAQMSSIMYCIVLWFYTRQWGVQIRNIRFIFIFFVLYSSLLHLPPLRFHCADGCWDSTQDRCN